MTSQATLAEQQRAAQLQLRARMLRDFLRLAPIWKPGDPESFGLLIAAALPLIRVYRQLSAAIAASYYQAARATAGTSGTATTASVVAITDAQITASLYATGQVAFRNALSAGQTADLARETAVVRASGAVTRLALDAGRDTILQSVQNDEHAVGWARVTDGDPCAFCLTLASRGAVYKTEQTASFEAHDHCGCSAMAVFDGTRLPDSTRRWADLYDQAQRDGEASGLLQPGENTSKARINAVRRLLTAQQT